jgi:uncharacterized protein with HEPN domain
MHPKTPKWLQDVLDGCDLILEAGRGQTQASFAGNRLLSAAVERTFEIIGEALNRIRKVDPATAQRIPDFRSIIGFRNVLIHGYDDLDYARVWQIMQDDVPALRETVARLLEEAGPPPI